MKSYLFQICFLYTSIVFSQHVLMNDDAYIKIAERSIEHLNNYDTISFNKSLDSFNTKYKNHPASPLLSSMKIYYQSVIDIEKTGEDTTYFNLLNQVISLSENILKNDPSSIEGLFFSLCGYGYLSQYYSDNNSFIRSIGEGRKAYKYYKKGKEFKDEFTEFYFISGTYNYYIVQYPENHPIVKPFMGLFEKGDKKEGLKQLDFATKTNSFTKASAYIYLIDILLKYEKNYTLALSYAKEFYRDYPKNPLACIALSKCYLLNNNYIQANGMAVKLRDFNKDFTSLYADLIDVWNKPGKTEQLITSLDQIILSGSQNTRICFDLLALAQYKKALLFSEANKKQEAKQAYRSALADTYWLEIDESYESFQKQ